MFNIERKRDWFLSKLQKSDKPIATRWYLFRSRMIGAKIHLLKGDKEFHNHPWWGFSIICGAYLESFEDEIIYTQEGHCRTNRLHCRRLLNIISPWRRHQIYVDKPTYTLFINFWRVNENWTYGGTTTPWRFTQEVK